MNRRAAFAWLALALALSVSGARADVQRESSALPGAPDTSYREQFAADVQAERQRNFSPPSWDFKPGRTIHVATDGKAENNGTAAAPFATLKQARDAIRKFRPDPKDYGVEVIIRGGVYPMTETLTLEEQDSKTVYVACKGETVTLTGGRDVGGTAVHSKAAPAFTNSFTPVADPQILDRLPPESRGKVQCINLRLDQTYSWDIPPLAPRGAGHNGPAAAPWVQLFVNDQPLTLARYPNDGFIHTGKALRAFVNTPAQGDLGAFEFTDDRALRWRDAPDAWLFGYWGHLWAATACKVADIDQDKRQISLATNNPYGHRDHMPFHAFNLLEELDAPGEWYLDRATGILYLIPPLNPDGQPLDLNRARVRLALFPDPFIAIRDAARVTLDGLRFEEGAGTALTVSGGERVTVSHCRFERFGNWGIAITGSNHRVTACDLATLGGGGIALDGGDIPTLTPGNHLVEHSTVSDFTRVDRAYAPAISVNGVGHRLAHNLLRHSPHHAIRVDGMAHTVEYNEIHHVVLESDDQSGLDAWGNPFLRGLTIRHNYWHHIGSGRDVAGQGGIRLDDAISSVLMYGNVFWRASGGGFGGIQIHGGKDNLADNNLFLDCQYAVTFSPWEPERWRRALTEPGNFGDRQRRAGYAPESELFLRRYPDYARLAERPNRNYIINNLAIGGEQFFRHENGNNFLANNHTLPWRADYFQYDPAGKPTLPEDSPLYRQTGLRPIPFDLIGPRR